MRKVVLIATAFAFVLMVQPAFAAKPGDKAVLAALDAWKEAMLKKDAAALEKLFHPDLSYAHSSALVQNKAGKFPVPGIPSTEAAARTVTSLQPDNAVSITDPPASEPGAYPISTFTYALVPQQTSKASTLKPFLAYAVGDGQELGKQFQFAPLPQLVVTAGRDTIAQIHP